MGLRPHNGQPTSPVLINKYQQNIQIFESSEEFHVTQPEPMTDFPSFIFMTHNFYEIFQVLSPKSPKF